MSFRPLVVAVTVAALAGSGCRGAPAKPAPAAAPSATETPTPVETTSSPTPDATVSDEIADPSDSESPSGPAVLATTVSGRSLTLSDVFSAEGEWEESRYDVGDRSEIQGIAARLRGCGEDEKAELELRLAHHFSRLTMNVGQANNSRSSDVSLVVAIVANGKQVDVRRVPFDRIQPFTVNVKDVNAVKLRFWIDDAQCEYGADIVAVIEKLTVSG
jgi:hypothetical protein